MWMEKLMSTTHWTEAKNKVTESESDAYYLLFYRKKSDTPSRKVLEIVCSVLQTRKVDGGKLNPSALTFSQSSPGLPDFFSGKRHFGFKKESMEPTHI